MIVRPTARLVVLDADDRVLLFKIEDHLLGDPTDQDRPRTFWVTPGGGLEDGESFEDAARREMRKETGLMTTLGPCVLERDKVLRQGEQDILFRMRFFCARAEPADVVLHGLSELERTVYRDHRWWSAEELAETDELIVPEDLSAIVEHALTALPSR